MEKLRLYEKRLRSGDCMTVRSGRSHIDFEVGFREGILDTCIQSCFCRISKI